MVLTRSQAAKAKATQSPEPSPKLNKQHRKKQAGGAAEGGSCAAATALDKHSGSPPNGDTDLPLAGKPVIQSTGMGAKASKLSRVPGEPTSHPITSLPASPAVSPAAGVHSEFKIAAVQQQLDSNEQQQAMQAVPPSASSPEPSQDGAAEQASASEAATIQQRHDGHVEATADSQVPKQQAKQLESHPVREPPREKLLKPLPDKPIACDKLPDGPEPVVVDVEYPARQDLRPVDDPAAAYAALLPGLQAADWQEAVRSLNVLRQLAVHHPDACAPHLAALIPAVLKSVRSLRSSVCKTAIMAVADLYLSYAAALLPLTDVGGQLQPATSLLAQILLKCSSNDKKFVVEEAQHTLQVMVESLDPPQLLPLLLPYADQHKNPKVRGKAGAAVADTVARMDARSLLAHGHPELLRVAGKLVTDNTPDARDSAKRLIGSLKAAFSDPEVEARLAVPQAADAPSHGEDAPPPPTPWEAYCQATLSSSAAMAVIKASSD